MKSKCFRERSLGSIPGSSRNRDSNDYLFYFGTPMWVTRPSACIIIREDGDRLSCTPVLYCSRVLGVISSKAADETKRGVLF